MVNIDVKNMNHKSINEAIRDKKNCTLENCNGQRFIAASASDKRVTIKGVPGNALGAYLNGATIDVLANAQDAVGDTMNEGEIIIHGNAGDAIGYAMRGGKIYVKGNAGYRAGIHMKAYKEKRPVLVIGGNAGCFLGEYQAGGIIIVLGLDGKGEHIVGDYPSTGMHGGKIFIRSDCKGISFPKNVNVTPATEDDLKEIKPYIKDFCKFFECDAKDVLKHKFSVITPDSKNPYKQMYVAN